MNVFGAAECIFVLTERHVTPSVEMRRVWPVWTVLTVLQVTVQAPPPPLGELQGVTDQEIIRALSLLLTQEKEEERRPRQGVTFRTRDQLDLEERRLMDLVESERQSLSKEYR